MRIAGRSLLLFFLAWAAFWGTPACSADEEGPPVRLELSLGMRPGFTSSLAHREVSETAPEPLPSGALGRAPAKGQGSELPASRRATLARAGTAPSLPSDILLLIQRQNE